MSVAFFVSGVPVPQGSMSVSRQGHIYHSNSAVLKSWRNTIAARARIFFDEAQLPPLDGPVKVSLKFYFTKPKKGRDVGLYKTTTPDLDKLQRAVFDALTGIAYTDDCRVAVSEQHKLYVDESASPGVLIQVLPLISE